MRILHVNKFLYRKGGAESYMLDLADLQRAAGDRVEFWGMAHPDNPDLPLAGTFPSHIELEPPPSSVTEKAVALGRIVWSTSSLRGMTQAVREFRPDVVHLHNIYHQLSPSILRPLAKAGIPVVMTLHDYKLACPTYQFLDHGLPCEACIGGGLHQAVRRRCRNDSMGASAVMAAELWLHRATRAYGVVSRLICPSRFMMDKMRAAGVFPDRLVHVPHFIDTSSITTKVLPGGPVVFAGRLSPEKGIDTLVRAVGRLRTPLVVAGDGPERAALESLAHDVAPGLVRFAGVLTKPEVHDLLRAGSVAVLPARWYENQPMSVLEAFACGLPVVGTDLGGLPELIETGVNGAVVPPNSVDALAAALAPFVVDSSHAFQLGRNARRVVTERFAPEVHLDRIRGIYSAVQTRVAA